ncbi:MAG TPA: hypothetical protein P5021_09755, partial [Candidatus Diapherotrites archaeon]|nr:hypothetical protein [Candidatus Diapherotrites archaeon]
MKVISIIKKDLKTILSDKKALAIIIVMPLVLMTILSSALRGAFTTGGQSIDRINIAVVKQYDKDGDSRRFDKALRDGFLVKGIGEEAAAELRVTGDDVDPERIFLEDFLGSEDVAKIIAYRVEKEETAVEWL